MVRLRLAHPVVEPRIQVGYVYMPNVEIKIAETRSDFVWWAAGAGLM